MPGGACRLGRGPVAVFSTHSQGLELGDRHEPGLALRHGDGPGLAEDRPGHDPVCGSSHDVSGAFLLREFRVDVAAGRGLPRSFVSRWAWLVLRHESARDFVAVAHVEHDPVPDRGDLDRDALLGDGGFDSVRAVGPHPQTNPQDVSLPLIPLRIRLDHRTHIRQSQRRYSLLGHNLRIRAAWDWAA